MWGGESGFDLEELSSVAIPSLKPFAVLNAKSFLSLL